MRKIPTLFVRDPENRSLVLPEVNPGCEWVLNGEGTATRKWDGTCVMLEQDGSWWARREVKPGKAFPPNYRVVSIGEVTGKTMGWEPVEQSSFAKFHAEALSHYGPYGFGTYELIGPKINGGRDGSALHRLIRHGWAPPHEKIMCEEAPRTFDGLREWLVERPWEGLVFHRELGVPDTDMVKIKARDFGIEG